MSFLRSKEKSGEKEKITSSVSKFDTDEGVDGVPLPRGTVLWEVKSPPLSTPPNLNGGGDNMKHREKYDPDCHWNDLRLMETNEVRCHCGNCKKRARFVIFGPRSIRDLDWWKKTTLIPSAMLYSAVCREHLDWGANSAGGYLLDKQEEAIMCEHPGCNEHATSAIRVGKEIFSHLVVHNCREHEDWAFQLVTEKFKSETEEEKKNGTLRTIV